MTTYFMVCYLFHFEVVSQLCNNDIITINLQLTNTLSIHISCSAEKTETPC